MNLDQRIGGNAPLSSRGKLYSEKLAEFIKKENLPDLIVWTSQFKRTIQTASKIDAPKEQWKALYVLFFFKSYYQIFNIIL